MTTLRTIGLLALILIAVGTIQAADPPLPDEEVSSAKISWYSYQDGWEKAKAENKHMFVDFTATWCGWCKRLEATTFLDSQVVAGLNGDFVPVKVWDNSKDTVDLDGYRVAETDLIKKEFQVRGFPALWFVSPEGVRVGPAGGYVEAARLLGFMDIVKNYRYDSTRTETGEKITAEDN